ncbi:DUF2236-containing protein [Aureococcus anophagefferens]|nr:DUF2236-containing protein [Aureococcus anophagefferens]
MDHIASRRIDAPVASWHSWDAFRDPPAEVQLGCGVAKYGQRFVWTKLHLTASQLAPLRLEGDAPMDAATAEVAGSGREVGAAVLRSSPGDGTACGACLAAASELPDWVDLERVGRGQKVFQRYLPHVSVTLFYLSLVGGFSAAVITKVLFSTGYLASSPRLVMRRLLDTGLFLFDVCLDGPESLRPGGRGLECCLEEDMVVTLLAFSYNVLVGVEFLKGSRVSEEEEGDYLHLWRYLGHLLGVRDEHNPCASYAAAKATLESIVVHILEPDADSKKLAKAMLAAPSGGDATGYAFLTRAELCRYMVGDALADALDLPVAPPSLRVKLVRLWLAAVGVAIDSRLGRLFGIAHALQMRAVRRLHGHLRSGSKRHDVAATVDAPVATCPYEPAPAAATAGVVPYAGRARGD